MNPDDFRRLVAAGLTTDQIAVVMEMMDREATKVAEAEEARREKGRERWHKWDAKRKANVSKREQTLANNSCEGVARGEDNLQTNDTSGKEERKVTSPSARSSRGSRIPEDFLPDIDAAVSEGVPRPEAERQARSFCDYWRSKPGAGGLKLDWPATWRVWYRRNLSSVPQPKATAPPRQAEPRNAGERALRRLQELEHEPRHESTGHDAIGFGDGQAPGSRLAGDFAGPTLILSRTG